MSTILIPYPKGALAMTFPLFLAAAFTLPLPLLAVAAGTAVVAWVGGLLCVGDTWFASVYAGLATVTATTAFVLLH